MGIIDLLAGKLEKAPGTRGQKHTCPVCKSDITLDMEKCPKCGSRIADILVLICPDCKGQIPIGATECPKCRYSLVSRPKQKYICPMCRYSADYWMLQCPACGVKFSS